MCYIANTGLLLSWLSTVFGLTFTVDSILSDFYDPTLGSWKPNNITVGVQTTIEWWGLGDEGTFFININRINNQTDILPYHHIRPILKDDGYDEQRAFFVGLELSGVRWSDEAEEPIERVDFLFGAGFSKTTISSAFVTQSFKTPQMSCTATSTDLSNKDVYGTFSRTIASDATQSCAWAAIASNFNWTRIGVISSKNDYGLGLSQGLSNCVDDFDISIVEEITFESGQTDHRAKLATIATSDVFVYFVAMHNADMQSLSLSLAEMNLTGFPYVYVGGDAAGENTTLFIKTLPGFIYTSPFQAILETSELISLQEHYEATNNDWATSNEEEPSSDGLGVFGAYCWDIALVLADFFHNYTKLYPDSPTTGLGEDWSSFLQNYSKPGATGLLEFDENLDPALTRWTIFNCNDTKCNIIGETSLDEVQLYYPTRNHTTEIYWPKGVKGISNTPPDRSTETEKWIYIHFDAKLFYGFFSGTTVIMSIFLIFLSYRWRNENSVRMTSWKLNILSLFAIDMVMLCFLFQVMDENDWGQDTLESFCFARTFSFLTGFSIFIGTMFSKIYRVHKIFVAKRLSERKKTVKDHHIVQVVLLYTALNLTILIIFQLLFPYKRETNHGNTTRIDIVTYQHNIWGSCEMEHSQLLQIILLVSNGGVLILGAKWAWETRGVKYAALNDSVQVGYILMLIILLCSFNFICTSLIDDPNFDFFISFISMLLITWFTIGVLFLHKYWHMFSLDEEEDDGSAYESGVTFDNRCSHCNMILPQTNYSMSPRVDISGNTAGVELAKSDYSVRIPEKTKTIEDMSIDEFLDGVDLSNNSALEENTKIDTPKANASSQKK